MKASGPAAFALVGLGGAAGAMLRHAVSLALPLATWPRATLLVNVTGCLAFGLAAGWAAGRMPETTRLLLVTGLLGGYTTFSAFGGEAASLLRQRPFVAGAYVSVSVVAGVLAVLLGERLGLFLRASR